MPRDVSVCSGNMDRGRHNFCRTRCPLFCASALLLLRYYDIAQFLLNSYVPSSFCHCILSQAVLDDNQVVVRLLLVNGADVNKPDIDG